MAQSRRILACCIPVLLSGLCAMSTGCQCSFNCTPTFKGPNCGPNGCGGGGGYGGGGPNAPAGAGQWAQSNHDASHQPGQWGQGCNSPGGYGGGQPVYPAAYQGGYQQPPMQQQPQGPNVQLGPTPMPDRAPDRMPNAQGNNNMNVPYSGTLTNGSYMQGNGGGSTMQMPFSQGAQGAPFGPTPMMQQGAPNLPGPSMRPVRQGDGNDNTLPAPRIMPTEAPYSP